MLVMQGTDLAHCLAGWVDVGLDLGNYSEMHGADLKHDFTTPRGNQTNCDLTKRQSCLGVKMPCNHLDRRDRNGRVTDLKCVATAWSASICTSFYGK